MGVKEELKLKDEENQKMQKQIKAIQETWATAKENKEELKALKQQMKLKDEENRKMKKQIKAIQETAPTDKEKKKLKKLLKKDDGDQVLLKRPGTDANLVNEVKDVKKENEELK